MTVLVTGGAGYVGSHVLRRLRASGREALAVDTLELGYREAVLDAPLVVADIADRATIERVIEEHRVDSVVHCAGYKSPAGSMSEPSRYFTNNVAASAYLLESLVAAGVANLVFSSTCALYGTPARLPVDETHPVSPESPYGESKRLVEEMLGWMDRCGRLRSVSLRYFNAAGASEDGVIGEDWRNTANLLPLTLRVAFGRSESLLVYGSDYPTNDGSAVRDYVHVEDLATAHLAALDHLERGGASSIVNLGSGRGTSVLEIVETVERVTGARVPITLAERRRGDPSAVYADFSLASRLLSWRPERDLDDIVESAWQWHRRNPDGYRR